MINLYGSNKMIRIGHGYDAHRFGENRKLILGGVHIPFHLGMVAHSDGDVVIHAICDALLGAGALGDIGQHFSDKDPKFLNIDSRILLRHVGNLLKTNKFNINNIDATILAENPKLAPYILKMRENIADDLGLFINYISVKATTTEKLGFIGREEGIAVYAVTLIEST